MLQMNYEASEALRIKVAERVGWRDIAEEYTGLKDDTVLMGRPPRCVFAEFRANVPDYPNDETAMRRALETIKREQWGTYAENLRAVIREATHDEDEQAWLLITPKAEHQAEAMVRTVSKTA